MCRLKKCQYRNLSKRLQYLKKKNLSNNIESPLQVNVSMFLWQEPELPHQPHLGLAEQALYSPYMWQGVSLLHKVEGTVKLSTSPRQIRT